MVRPELQMQPRNLSLGVAKQLGPDGPGEGRQARAGALCALACVILARHLRKEVHKRLGWAGREKNKRKGKDSKAGANAHEAQACSVFSGFPPSQCSKLCGNVGKDASELHDKLYLALVQSSPGFPLL